MRLPSERTLVAARPQRRLCYRSRVADQADHRDLVVLKDSAVALSEVATRWSRLEHTDARWHAISGRDDPHDVLQRELRLVHVLEQRVLVALPHAAKIVSIIH
mgnify:CR=1 FL=1